MTNSQNGTKDISCKHLTAPDICAILRACHESQVRSFQGYGLNVAFVRKEKRQLPTPLPPTVATVRGNPTTQFEVDPDFKPLSEQDQRSLLADIKESQELIDNPLGFEQASIDECLEQQQEREHYEEFGAAEPHI